MLGGVAKFKLVLGYLSEFVVNLLSFLRRVEIRNGC